MICLKVNPKCHHKTYDTHGDLQKNLAKEEWSRARFIAQTQVIAIRMDKQTVYYPK